MDRAQLIKTLLSLTSMLFKTLIVRLGPPSGVMSSWTTPQENRIVELILWAEGPEGPGLERVQQTLNSIIKFPVAVSSSPITSPPKIDGRLAFLETHQVGPAKRLTFEPAERLSMIAGDNGLGKTFLLECAWWALTRDWAGLPAAPRKGAKRPEPKIIYRLVSDSSDSLTVTADFNFDTQRWGTLDAVETIPGLCLYSRADGSFAIWDPIREFWRKQYNIFDFNPAPPILTQEQIWNGLEGQNIGNFINGLILDWAQWQTNPKFSRQFAIFKKVLERLSPPEQGDLGTLKPGKTTRIPFDSREFPTIKHPYGEIPIIHASAGIKRILSLAYMITWLWSEHQINAENVQRPHQKRLVVLVDEMEAHLHPQWQRVILPALLEVQKELSSELEMQLMVATHSPLVVASLETEFDHERDKLFHLDIAENGRSRREVELKEVPFIKRGRADLWLMSDIFGLKQPRSLQAEKAIEEATALQLQEKAEPEEVRRVNTELLKTLAQDDEFWPLWRYFAKQNGLTK